MLEHAHTVDILVSCIQCKFSVAGRLAVMIGSGNGWCMEGLQIGNWIALKCE